MAKTAANVLVGVATLYYNPTAGTVVDSVTTEVGYTEDGVVFEYNPTIEDIGVDEETVPLKRVITKEEITVTCNLAESSLNNIEQALAGASRADNVITLGGGSIQEIALKIVGDSPDGANKRTIYLPYVNPVGTIGMSYKKGEKTIIPVSFKPFKNAVDATVCTITDVA